MWKKTHLLLLPSWDQLWSTWILFKKRKSNKKFLAPVGDLPPGDRPMHFWFGEVGIARANVYGRPLAPSRTAQVAFGGDVSAERCQKAEMEIWAQDGACGRQMAWREHFSCVLPCETPDGRFSSPREALAVTFLGQWRAQCIFFCKHCWHWLELWVTAGARVVTVDLCLRSNVLPVVSAQWSSF